MPGEAEEPTSTIVLTSHTSHYVDVRIYKDVLQKELDRKDGINPLAVVEWAFAGTSSTTEISSGPANNELGDSAWHCVWEHWIDSKSDDPKPDEGDMWAQTNGDVLERGVQIHPLSGLQTTYEELWGDLDVELLGGEKRVSIVLKVENKETNTRGMVVRVGGWCQGILKSGGELHIERWQWTELKNSWERIVKIGSSDLPCAMTFGSQNVSEKGTVTSGGLEWKVIEKFIW